MPVVVCGCETWLNEGREYNLKVYENRVLRKIFGPSGDEVAGYGRRVYNENLHVIHSSPNTFLVVNLKRVRWEGHEARMGEKAGTYWVVVEKPEGK